MNSILRPTRPSTSAASPRVVDRNLQRLGGSDFVQQACTASASLSSKHGKLCASVKVGKLVLLQTELFLQPGRPHTSNITPISVTKRPCMSSLTNDLSVTHQSYAVLDAWCMRQAEIDGKKVGAMPAMHHWKILKHVTICHNMSQCTFTLHSGPASTKGTFHLSKFVGFVPLCRSCMKLLLLLLHFVHFVLCQICPALCWLEFLLAFDLFEQRSGEFFAFLRQFGLVTKYRQQFDNNSQVRPSRAKLNKH